MPETGLEPKTWVFSRTHKTYYKVQTTPGTTVAEARRVLEECNDLADYEAEDCRTLTDLEAERAFELEGR